MGFSGLNAVGGGGGGALDGLWSSIANDEVFARSISATDRAFPRP